MKKESILDELRRIRDERAARFNYDVDAMIRDLQAREKASGRKLYDFSTRKRAKVKRRRRAQA